MEGVDLVGYDSVAQANIIFFSVCLRVRACVCPHGCYFGSVIISRTGGVTSVLWLFDNTWVLSAQCHWICLRDILPCFCACPRAYCQTSPTDTNQRRARDCTFTSKCDPFSSNMSDCHTSNNVSPRHLKCCSLSTLSLHACMNWTAFAWLNVCLPFALETKYVSL